MGHFEINQSIQKIIEQKKSKLEKSSALKTGKLECKPNLIDVGPNCGWLTESAYPQLLL